jgi:hypothetical protein
MAIGRCQTAAPLWTAVVPPRRPSSVCQAERQCKSDIRTLCTSSGEGQAKVFEDAVGVELKTAHRVVLLARAVGHEDA